jgi:hypothetical protein
MFTIPTWPLDKPRAACSHAGMSLGFDHFDNSHRENFLSALLLLVMEGDSAAQELLVGLIRARAGVLDLGRLREFGREARFSKDEHDRYQRSDLWLQFDHGTVLVEVKSHGGWDPVSVAEQVRKQSAGSLVRSGETAKGVVLLAPRLLAQASPHTFLGWSDVIAGLRNLKSTSTLTNLVLRHLETHVERPMGFQNQPVADLAAAARTISCLREFLRTCARRVDGVPDSKELYLTGADGEPNRHDGWAWFGLSVPFKLVNSSYRVGVYTYPETPTGREEAKQGAWLEVYREAEYEPLVEQRFDATALAPQQLDAACADFVKAWNARKH